MEIDLNCDMGERSGSCLTAHDLSLFPYLTSCNISCGAHGGDPLYIENTLKKALEYTLQIGAHPSYPDRQGFGRQKIVMEPVALKAAIKYQLAALMGLTESLGGTLAYVKPHGALYNEIAKDEKEAVTVIEAIKAIEPRLALVGLAGSPLAQLAARYGLRFIPEAFADRAYRSDGQLLPRSEKNAVFTNPQHAAEQALSIVLRQEVKTISGDYIPITARSICIHGDNPAALAILKALDVQLEAHGISKRKFSVL